MYNPSMVGILRRNFLSGHHSMVASPASNTLLSLLQDARGFGINQSLRAWSRNCGTGGNGMRLPFQPFTQKSSVVSDAGVSITSDS